MTLLNIHSAWAWVVIFANGLAGLWMLGAAKVPGLRTRAMLWFTVFAESAIVVQVLLGLALLASGFRAPFFHYFYGIVATITITLLFVYRGRMRRKRYWLYGFGGLFLMGLCIRALLVVILA